MYMYSWSVHDLLVVDFVSCNGVVGRGQDVIWVLFLSHSLSLSLSLSLPLSPSLLFHTLKCTLVVMMLLPRLLLFLFYILLHTLYIHTLDVLVSHTL